MRYIKKNYMFCFVSRHLQQFSMSPLTNNQALLLLTLIGGGGGHAGQSWIQTLDSCQLITVIVLTTAFTSFLLISIYSCAHTNVQNPYKCLVLLKNKTWNQNLHHKIMKCSLNFTFQITKSNIYFFPVKLICEWGHHVPKM